MAPLRPIGHIAGNLRILAVSACYRVRLASDGQRFLCWVDDDGCVYLALSHHPRAIAVRRHSPESIVRTYGKPKGAPFPLTVTDIHDDLQQASSDFARRSLSQASEAAA